MDTIKGFLSLSLQEVIKTMNNRSLLDRTLIEIYRRKTERNRREKNGL